jgi:DNA-binding transcriptional LysR family regulator
MRGTWNSADLRSLALFARVVETRSLTRAGRSLEMTTSAASKRIADLEARLGVRLVERTTRRVWPTAAGSEFYERCSKILSEIHEAEVATMQLAGRPCGPLRACIPAALGERHLVPLTAEFGALYPEIRFDIVLSDGDVALADGDFDLAVTLSPVTDQNLVGRRLGSDRAVVCAAPSYLERNGTPATLDDLLAHDCLHLKQLPLQEEWTFVSSGGKQTTVPIVPRAHFNHTNAVRAAAVAGLGIANLPRLAVVEALRSGTLRSVLDDYVARELVVMVVYPAGAQHSRSVRTFADFLAQQLPPRLLRGSPASNESPPNPRDSHM